MKYHALAIAVLTTLSFSLPATAQDPTYRKNIRPLMEQKCLGCHGAGAPDLGEFNESPDKYKATMKGPRMNSYAELVFYIGWPDTGAVMRRLDDGKSVKGGKPGNMYAFLGADENERQKNLKMFKAWVGEDAWTLKRFQARGEVPGISKEELAKMKLKY
jgi:hypothetical protein